jgi:hypothetical protein
MLLGLVPVLEKSKLLMFGDILTCPKVSVEGKVGLDHLQGPFHL